VTGGKEAIKERLTSQGIGNRHRREKQFLTAKWKKNTGFKKRKDEVQVPGVVFVGHGRNESQRGQNGGEKKKGKSNNRRNLRRSLGGGSKEGHPNDGKSTWALD